jgi:hypothetical protein
VVVQTYSTPSIFTHTKHLRAACLHAAIDLMILVVPGAVQVQKRTQGKVEPKGKVEAAKRGPTTPSLLFLLLHPQPPRLSSHSMNKQLA